MQNTYTHKNSISKKSPVTSVTSVTLSEIQLQAKCFQWAWNTYPETRKCIAHVPNGGSRNKIEAMQLKASGVVEGVHDLFFYWKGQLYWFELKVGKNTQSKEQKEFGAAMKAQGAICHEIRDEETFKTIFKNIIDGVPGI